jgi:hypothetical protein
MEARASLNRQEEADGGGDLRLLGRCGELQTLQFAPYSLRRDQRIEMHADMGGFGGRVGQRHRFA